VPVRIALPKGRLLTETAALLKKAGWQLSGYDTSLRNYRLSSGRFPELLIKVFQEKDIPIQVAIGNYDLGICGLDWIEELSTKYTNTALTKVKNLGYGNGALYIAGSRTQMGLSLDALRAQDETIRIASEYPNIAESFALNLRLRRFSIFPVWGAAEAYPPESATLALISGSPDGKSLNNGLIPLSKVIEYSAFLIANRQSWKQKDISEILATLEKARPDIKDVQSSTTPALLKVSPPPFPIGKEGIDTVRIALPDGHQQKFTVELLNRAGIQIDDYPSDTGNRRPNVKLEGIVAKVIRPQDMPLQVANGNFDLAITGRDWLTDHLAAFPSSPVRELLDLKFGWVRIVAVVSNSVPADNIYALQQQGIGNGSSIRVASEYINLADKYARENHLGMYRIIPTWGATEAFLPEDADLLIENTETGSTIARHNLKIIDTLFESTARLIGIKNGEYSSIKKARIDRIIKLLSDGTGK
jgi:ATP phosphoribosyltransferase